MSNAADRLGYPVVDLPASVTSADAAVKFLVGELVRSGRLKPECAELVTCQVLHRESLGSTGVGGGVAMPHSKSDAVSEVLGIVGRSSAPMAWQGTLDQEPVREVCLLITPTSRPGASLRALEVAVRQLRSQ